MKTEGIETFLAIVRKGTLTEAANYLFISQSALSHRLAELENEIGAQLISRGRGQRSLTLTDRGKDFYAIAKRWEDLSEDAKRLTRSTYGTNLVIGAVDTMHTYVFPPLYRRIRDKAPWLNLRIRTYNSSELYFCVDRGEIDIAFPLIDLALKDVTVERFLSDPRVVLRYEDKPSGSGRFISANDLDMQKEVFFEGDQSYSRWHEQWGGKRSFPSLSVDTAPLLLNLLNEDGAWAIVPLCLAKFFSENGRYTYYMLNTPPPERICYKIKPSGQKASIVAGIAVVEECIREVFGSVKG